MEKINLKSYNTIIVQKNNLHQSNSEKKLIINGINYIDIDKYRDELIKTKKELNKRNIEYNNLKVEYLKLENENKSNLKLIQLVINETSSKDNSYLDSLNNLKENNGSSTNINTILPNKNNINTKCFNINEANSNNNLEVKDGLNICKKKPVILCTQTIKKIREKYLYKKMREEISHLKEELNEKTTIMSNLKNNSKIIKLRELDNKYAETYNELKELKDKYKKVEYIKSDYFNTKNQIALLYQELDFYRKQVKMQKEHNEKLELENKNNMMTIERQENQKTIDVNKKKILKTENEKMKKIISNLKEKNKQLLHDMENLKNIKPPMRNLAKVEIENKRLRAIIIEYNREIERLKRIIEALKIKPRTSPDDFFMTSTKLQPEEEKQSQNNCTTNDIITNNNQQEEIKIDEDIKKDKEEEKDKKKIEEKNDDINEKKDEVKKEEEIGDDKNKKEKEDDEKEYNEYETFDKNKNIENNNVNIEQSNLNENIIIPKENEPNILKIEKYNKDTGIEKLNTDVIDGLGNNKSNLLNEDNDNKNNVNEISVLNHDGKKLETKDIELKYYLNNDSFKEESKKENK